MPGLKVFGRRWGLASDDLVFPEISEAILRFFWFIVMLCIYFLHSNPSECSGATYLQNYILVLLVYNSILILLCFVTSYVSSRGTILNGNPRRQIPLLIYLRSCMSVFELAWTIVGTYWISSLNLETCETHVVTAVKFTVAISWILLLVFLCGVWLTFDPLGHIHHSNLKITSQKAKKLWKLRLRVFFLCASQDDNAKGAFEEVAELLTDFFLDTDLVISDLWAGLLLLVNSDLQFMIERRRPNMSLDPPPEWMNVGLASRMMEFSLAVYGWPYYVMNKCSSKNYYHLLQKLQCCRQCRCDQVLVVRDNCCQCNTAAFLLQTGIREMDLFHVNFKNKIYEVPYVACADNKTSSIVVAIRGSMSLRDIVTDMCMSDESLLLEDSLYFSNNKGFGNQNGYVVTAQQPESENSNDISRDIRVHRGILNSARYVLNSLTSQNVIEDMQVLYPDYDLVITGHSLGAGVAAVLAMLLKPKFRNIRCFAFSPPGCVVSENVIPQSQDFIYSLVVGDDLVPRLSYQSMRVLKRSLLNAIDNYEQAKYEILLRGCYKLLCGPRNNTRQRLDHDVEAPPDPVIHHPINSTNSRTGSSTDEEPLLRGRIPSSNYTIDANPCIGRVNLYMPGRIMHVTLNPCEEEETRMCTPIRSSLPESQTFSSVWSDYCKFDEIKLSSKMVLDHLPFRAADILKRLAAEQAGPESLRF